MTTSLRMTSYGLKLRGLAGDVYAVDVTRLPADLAAAETVIRTAYRADVLSRIRLSDDEADEYATRHTATAMAQLRRAIDTGVCSHPIAHLCDDDPTSYYEIEGEAGSVRKMVL